MSKKPKKASRKKQGKKQAKSSVSNKKWPIKILVLIVILIGAYFIYDHYNTRVYSTDIEKTTSANVEMLRGGETRPTLSPVRFVGKTARAYKIAKENRELLDSMFCYCNCKKNNGHKSLLSCYADTHAVNCSICQDQAFYAHSRFQKGDDIARVRAAVDKRFWRPLR
jgi:hypothetical protein